MHRQRQGRWTQGEAGFDLMRVVAKGGGGAYTTEIKGVVMVVGEHRRIR
jgi:hypothetical protein